MGAVGDMSTLALSQGTWKALAGFEQGDVGYGLYFDPLTPAE